jgi:hypothetical protein
MMTAKNKENNPIEITQTHVVEPDIDKYWVAAAILMMMVIIGLSVTNLLTPAEGASPASVAKPTPWNQPQDSPMVANEIKRTPALEAEAARSSGLAALFLSKNEAVSAGLLTNNPGLSSVTLCSNVIVAWNRQHYPGR